MDKNNCLGKFVYGSYTPQRPGKVIRVIEAHVFPDFAKPQHACEVKWLNGETTIVKTYMLRDFEALIADHEKKVNTHKGKLEQLRAL